MKFHTMLGLLAVAVAMPVQSQETSAVKNSAAVATPTADAAKAGDAAAREALAKKEGDGDQASLLKQTLTSVDKDYTLIKKGAFQLIYDLNYAYIGQDKINTDLASGSATLFNIENVNSHTLTNTFSLDYGLLNNLTGNFTLPIVSKYTQSQVLDGTSNSFGDMSFGARFQPFEAKRDSVSITTNAGLRLPTGTSPYKVVAGSGIATGSGVTAFSGGINVNKIVDPVAIFGSFNLTYSRPATKLSQVMGSKILTEVRPGLTFGFGAGFAYALSYAITTSVSFQESIAAGSKLRFTDGINTYAVRTTPQTSGVLSLGLGYRLSPKTTLNTSVGIGLTANSPNFTLDMTLPLSF
jgi:hypothetical protein